MCEKMHFKLNSITCCLQLGALRFTWHCQLLLLLLSKHSVRRNLIEQLFRYRRKLLLNINITTTTINCVQSLLPSDICFYVEQQEFSISAPENRHYRDRNLILCFKFRRTVQIMHFMHGQLRESTSTFPTYDKIFIKLKKNVAYN